VPGAILVQTLCCSLVDVLIEENKALAPYTTFGIGGPARWFVEARTEEEIVAAAAWARERGVPVFVLGGGSNLVVADSGFDGMVVQFSKRGFFAEESPGGRVLFKGAAGTNWDLFVEDTIRLDCAGIECLAGIPGTVGGTPVQNVGAYGQEVSSVIERVRAIDLRDGRAVEFTAAECGFSYRKSRFNCEDSGRYFVTAVDYGLQRGGAPAVRYAELHQLFEGVARPTLTEVANAVRQIRRGKGMLLVEGDPDCRSAGSFFKNPVAALSRVEEIAAAAGKQPPQFPAGEDGLVKLPAAWLIEQSGFRKGFAMGAAGISSRHTLALINRGGATAADVMALAERIRAAVEERFKVRLELEPVLLGF
jgi:UDP-N-acetylmuramate dehydrogenase